MQEIGITKSPKLQRFAVVALGWVLILLGIVGLVLPVVPGAVLIVVGVLMVNPSVRGCGECWREMSSAVSRPSARL